MPEFTCVLDQDGRAPVLNGEYYRTHSEYIENELTSRRQEGLRWFNTNQSSCSLSRAMGQWKQSVVTISVSRRNLDVCGEPEPGKTRLKRGGSAFAF